MISQNILRQVPTTIDTEMDAHIAIVDINSGECKLKRLGSSTLRVTINKIKVVDMMKRMKTKFF